MGRARRFARLLNIISTVVLHPGLGPGELARAAGISERTLFRDLATLRRLGVEVDFRDGYQLQETLALDGSRAISPVALPAVYEQQLKLLRSHLPPEIADGIQAEVESRAPAALAALFEEAMARRVRG